MSPEATIALVIAICEGIALPMAVFALKHWAAKRYTHKDELDKREAESSRALMTTIEYHLAYICHTCKIQGFKTPYQLRTFCSLYKSANTLGIDGPDSFIAALKDEVDTLPLVHDSSDLAIETTIDRLDRRKEQG